MTSQISLRRRRLAAALGAGSLLACTGARAQGAIPRQVTFMLPQATGGGTDVFARAISTRLPKVLDTAIVMDYRPGAGGNVGSAWFARSAPRDGSSWMITVSSTQTINPLIYAHPGFDPIADFEPVCGIGILPVVLMASNDMPVKTLADIVALARKEPGRYSFGSPGSGTISHLLMEYLKLSQKVQLVHVPYKGTAPALTDLAGGQINFLVSSIPPSLPLIRAGRVKAIAVPSQTRSAVLPNVPLASDVVPGMVGDIWVALYAPKGTPREPIAQMREAVGKVLALPELDAVAEAQGGILLKAGPDEILALTTSEMERWRPVVKATGLKVD